MVLTGPLTLQLTRPQGDMAVAAHPSAFSCALDSCTLDASFVETVSGLKVPPAFPWHQTSCPALPSRAPLSVIVGPLGLGSPRVRAEVCSPAPRYCALLRLPSSVPVGPLLAPFRYLGLTRSSLCPSRLAPGSARLLAASASKRQGVDCAGHPCSGDCSQGDGRLSRVPGLPFCPHAPLSDPGGVPPACLGANRTAAFRCSAYRRLWVRLPELILLSTIIHFSEFNDAACVLALPLLRTPPLGDRTSVRLPTWWLAFGRVGLESFALSPTG